jgi:hypothetical protein
LQDRKSNQTEKARYTIDAVQAEPVYRRRKEQVPASQSGFVDATPFQINTPHTPFDSYRVSRLYKHNYKRRQLRRFGAQSVQI